MSQRLAPALLVILALTACGGGHKSDNNESDKDGKPADSQVVAKVDDQEISIHQLNIALSQVPANLPPEKAHEAQKQALNRLIDQEILVKQAIAKKMDREPKVVQVIEANRRAILARAYLESLTTSTSPATREEIDAFYNQHPELFSARQIYRVQQLQLQGTPDLGTLEGAVKGSRNLADVAKNLATAKIGFNETTATIGPEQLPMPLAAEFAKLKVGNIVVVPQPNGTRSIVQILAAQDAAIPKDKAQPAVERFLNNQRQNEAAANEMKTLKAKAKIVYLGEFDPKREAEKKPDLGATGPGAGAVTVDQKTLASDPAGVVTIHKPTGGNEPSGAVTVKTERTTNEQTGVVTVNPDALKK